MNIEGNKVILEKAQATVALITEQSSDAIGDLDNTSDGFANTTRRLKAELRQTGLEMGQELLPAVSGVLPILSKLAQDILPLVADAFKKGVVVVQEFLDKFGDDILSGLKKSFQIFQDLGTIFFDMVGKFIKFIQSSEILSGKKKIKKKSKRKKRSPKKKKKKKKTKKKTKRKTKRSSKNKKNKFRI